MTKIKAKLYHWYNPGEYSHDTFTIPDLADWIVNHGGAVIVKPPSVTGRDWWLIIVTDETNKFHQK